MLRAFNIAVNTRILQHRYPVTFQLACISRLPPPQQRYKPEERPTCPPPPPPPPPKPPDDSLLWGTLTLCVLAGAFTAFAKDQPEIRDWLTINAPWIDDFIAIVYQENMTHKEFAKKSYHDAKEYFGTLVQKYTKGEEENKPKQCSLEGTPVDTKTECTDPKTFQQQVPETIVIDDGETTEVCTIIPPPVTTRDICDIEKCLGEFCEAIIVNYISAKEACAYYNKEVEEVMKDFDMRKLARLHATKEERLELVAESMDNVAKAKAKLDELNHYFECGVKAPKEKMDFTRSRIQDCRNKIEIVDAEFQWENDKSIALDDLWGKVETVMNQYTEETSTLVRGVDYNSDKPVLTGDPDLLLYHSYRYMKKLESEVAEAFAAMSDRVNRAIDTLPQCDQKVVKARNNAIRDKIAAQRKVLDREEAKRIADQKARNVKTLQEKTKKQLERHQETLKIRLEQKEREATIKLNKLVAEKVQKEKLIFKNQLEEMRRKLSIVEAKLNERLKAERETKRSQELWVAGASLLAATKKGERRVNVSREIKAIEKASGDGDKLVNTVLKAIPESVKKDGLVPESVLKEKYRSMETVAMRVALVEADGAPLPVYFLSYMQSLFLFMRLSGIPRGEIEKPPQEPPPHLDTFDLLQRARYWIQQGNLAIAIRYVNALQGASRAAAAMWYQAAREHVETRQAAEAVLAHAAALGLQYI